MNPENYKMTTRVKESIKKITYSNEYIDYCYQHTDRALFKCIKLATEECRSARNRWIEECYLLGERQIVFENQSQAQFLILNPNMKGYVVLIKIETMCVWTVRRDCFFHNFNLLGENNQSETLDQEESYQLMLKADYLHFTKKK